ncbi:hypothetical protein SLS53_002871 [Cytospora paraplurivora]|uniref:2EXR domain-containing protein n=1 Tax=Cytospora paraplurivora TaxID=2898453 RepID=A0AAN9UFA5_9PEZI
MVTTRSQSKKLEAQKSAGFRKFQELPTELRLMVWDAALPRYGNIPLGCHCEKDEESSSSHATSFTIHLVLPPSSELAPDNKLPERIWTTRNLLMTCHESRKQAKEHSPDVLTCRKGEIRFNAEEDLITLCDHEGFEVTRGVSAEFTFAGDWNLSVRRLAVDWWLGFRVFRSYPYGVHWLRPQAHWGVEAVYNYLETLRKFPSLKQLFQIENNFIAISGYCGMDTSSRTLFRDDLGEIYARDMAYQTYRELISKPWLKFDLPLMTERVAGLRAVVHATHYTRRGWGPPLPLPVPSPRLFRLGDDELRYLEVLGMTDINPELRAKGIICTEMEL